MTKQEKQNKINELDERIQKDIQDGKAYLLQDYFSKRTEVHYKLDSYVSYNQVRQLNMALGNMVSLHLN